MQLYLDLTLKAPITTAADDIYKYLFIVFEKKIRLDISCESSARQRIHMKHQALFPSKAKSRKIKCRLLQFLFGAIRVNCLFITSEMHIRFRCAVTFNLGPYLFDMMAFAPKFLQGSPKHSFIAELALTRATLLYTFHCLKKKQKKPVIPTI